MINRVLNDGLTGFGGPFDLADESAYRLWREHKLRDLPVGISALTVPIQDPACISRGEIDALVSGCERHNMTVYQFPSEISVDRRMLKAFAHRLGLNRVDKHLCVDGDGISRLYARNDALHRDYIPYSNRPLSWHTDGYYNPQKRKIGTFLLHCVTAAAHGGENQFFDHELAYIFLRDSCPEDILSLMHADTLRIPANVSHGVTLRQAQDGPVFSVNTASNTLHMRYTARTRHSEWKQDTYTRRAAQRLLDLLQSTPRGMMNHRLQSGQGIICNNVLHCRNGFEDDDKRGRARLILRARYYDRICATDNLILESGFTQPTARVQ